MSLAPPPDAHSICWSCRYWDWYYRVAYDTGKTAENGCVDECNNPAEYTATGDKQECQGYAKESK